MLGNPSGVFIRKMLSTPANTLPSTDILCKAYIKTLLVSKSPDVIEDGTDATDEIENNENVETNADEVDDTSLNDAPFSPSKELLKKLRRLKFDFVQPIT